MARITILMNCPDQKGIIADVTNYIHKNKGNIEYIDQYVDRVNSIFFMRLECEINSNVFNENFKKEPMLDAHCANIRINREKVDKKWIRRQSRF